MNKSKTRKLRLPLLSIIFSLFCLAVLYGCGNGPDVEGTTPTPGGYSIALTASVSSLQTGQNSILTATVTNSSGTAVSGATVAFAFVTNNSTGTVVALNGGTTDAGGKAIAIYTAGATGSTTVEDIIKASATGSTGVVTITRIAGTGTSSSPDYISNLMASPSTVRDGQMSVITATVRHAGVYSEIPSNQTITFTIPVNNSGASFIDSGGASVSTITINTLLDWNTFTDISVTYRAGTNVSGTEVEDMVKATLGNGSTSSIIITRTGSVGGTGVRMTVSATPSSLVAGAMSIIVAQVNNANGTPAPGLAVTFGFLTNNSGAPALSVVNATTDASGTAVAKYTAGNNSPALSIQDVVTASVTGSAGAAIITRLPSVGTGNRIISFTETPETTPQEPLSLPWVNVIMKVKVTTDNLTSPVVGVTVTFSILVGGAGTLSSTTAITDTNGEAFIVFTPPVTGSGDTVIRAQIPGTINGGDAARIVYWTH